MSSKSQFNQGKDASIRNVMIYGKNSMKCYGVSKERNTTSGTEEQQWLHDKMVVEIGLRMMGSFCSWFGLIFKSFPAPRPPPPVQGIATKFSCSSQLAAIQAFSDISGSAGSVGRDAQQEFQILYVVNSLRDYVKYNCQIWWKSTHST